MREGATNNYPESVCKREKWERKGNGEEERRVGVWGEEKQYYLSYMDYMTSHSHTHTRFTMWGHCTMVTMETTHNKEETKIDNQLQPLFPQLQPASLPTTSISESR